MNVFLRNIFIITLYIAGCTNSSKKESVKKNTVKTFSKQKKQVKTKEDEPIYMEYLENDQVVIEDSLYRKIIKNELSEIPKFSKMYPDSLYFKKAFNTLKYGSEQGQDYFYQIYARYLSLHENKGIPKQQMDELETIYYRINVFISECFGSGSGHYHMIQRIPAYVNYDFLSYDRKIHQQHANPKEKKEFLDFIRRNIPKDREFILSSIIDDLEKKITTEFQLTKVKAFTKKRFGHLLH